MYIRKRAENIALLSALMSSTATAKQIETLRKSREPIHLTLILDEETANMEPHYPQYCMNCYEDGTTVCYDLHADGQKIERPKP